MDKRERLAVIFRDTQQFYSTDPALIAAVELKDLLQKGLI